MSERHAAFAPARSPSSLRTARLVLWLVIAVGGGAFLIALAVGATTRAWGTYLVNWLFWSGIVQAQIVFVALLQITNARWAGPFRRLAQAAAAFLPISFVAFLLTFLGRSVLFPWAGAEPETAGGWRSPAALYTRDVAALVILYGLSIVFVRVSIRAQQEDSTSATASRAAVTPRILAPIVVLSFAIGWSLLAIDLVMALEPPWYSTLFGGYFFVGVFYSGLAALAFENAVDRAPAVGPDASHDLGKLLFGFCLLWTYTIWSQYLPIWYAALPEETSFVVLRTKVWPWAPLAVTVLGLGFAVPFVLLLSRELKRRPIALASVALLVLVALWLERYLLVFPAIWKSSTLPLGTLEALVTAGFGAAFALSVLKRLTAAR